MGFLIDAVAHRIRQTLADTTMRYYRCYNLAEIIVRTCYDTDVMQVCC